MVDTDVCQMGVKFSALMIPELRMGRGNFQHRDMVFRVCVLIFALFSPVALQAQREKLPPEDLAIVEKMWPDAKRTATGLRTQILKPGQGENPVPGDKVSVLYVGRLLNGEVFDEANDAAKPFSFRVKRDQVIPAWDEGLQLMKLGEKRLLIVPYEIGYGTRGNPPKIPKRATLVFEVELLKIEK